MSEATEQKIEHDFEKELSAGEENGASTGAAAASKADRGTSAGYVSSDRTLYANNCNITGTPEEIMMDFANDPALFSTNAAEGRVDLRIVTSYPAAKRLALILSETLRRYEERFGNVEIDPRKRLKN